MSQHTRTDEDTMREQHQKLMKNLDRAHDNMHRQLPAPSSIAYQSISMDLQDAMDAALEVSKMLKAKGL